MIISSEKFDLLSGQLIQAQCVRCHIHSCSHMHELISLIVLIHSSVETHTKALALSILEGNPQNSTLRKIFTPERRRTAENSMKLCISTQNSMNFNPFRHGSSISSGPGHKR